MTCFVRSDNTCVTASPPILRSNNTCVTAAPIVRSDIRCMTAAPILRSDSMRMTAAPILRSNNMRMTAAPIVRSDNMCMTAAPIARSDNRGMTTAPPIEVEKIHQIQCEVCGHNASSFHYGANSCDACKIFFRRNLGKDMKHTCTKQTEYSTGVYDRNLKCSPCRMRRCLDAGMSLEDTRKGRYTYAKKYKCIQKTKQLKRRRSSNVLLSFPHTVTKEIEQIADNIAQLFLSCGTYDSRFFDELPQIEDAFLEKKQLETQVFGRMQPIPLTEYRQIFHCTGMDIDNRQEAITKRYLSYTRRLETYISFANKIATLKKLPAVDQAALFKGARVALVTISESRAFNLEKGIYTFPEKFVYEMSEMCLQGRADYVETWFTLANRVEKLNLTPQQANILKCIALFSSDNCVTEEGRVACDREQQFMVKVLEYLFKHQGAGAASGGDGQVGAGRGSEQAAGMAVARCLLLLADFRTLHHKDYLDYQFVSKEFTLVHFPDLLLKFYSQ